MARAFQELCDTIKKTAFKGDKGWSACSRRSFQRLGIPFGIIDLSLAPTPAVGDSVAEILEEIGLESWRTRNNSSTCYAERSGEKRWRYGVFLCRRGLSGALFRSVRIKEMIDAVNAGSLLYRKLEAMTCVCSVGLDMIAIPGKTKATTISGIIADEMAIGMVNQKTTAVRVIPVVGKDVGDMAEFGGLLGYAPIMPVNEFDCSAFVNRKGRIPAPIHSFKNSERGKESMGKVAIVTDSNSGITQAEGKKMGIYVLPMPFYINEELFYEDITLTQEEFYEKLAGDADIKTSQPAPGDVMDMWDKALEEYDEVVHIPMSAGLSSSCETAIMLSQDYDGKVQVVNNHRISVTQRRSVEEAKKKLADAGKSAAEIKELLEAIQWDSDIYITVDTLKYLKKGGRLTPAAAAIGTVLNLKPVLRLKGEKLDAFAKSRGWEECKEDDDQDN